MHRRKDGIAGVGRRGAVDVGHFCGVGRRGAVVVVLFLGDGLKLCGIFVVLRSVGAHSSVG